LIKMDRMDAFDLIVLGRQLTKIGEKVMRAAKSEALRTGPTSCSGTSWLIRTAP
jgi:hypothetical protein